MLHIVHLNVPVCFYNYYFQTFSTGKNNEMRTACETYHCQQLEKEQHSPQNWLSCFSDCSLTCFLAHMSTVNWEQHPVGCHRMTDEWLFVQSRGMCLKIPKTICFLNATLSHCWIWVSSFTNLVHHFIICSLSPCIPLSFFLFLPAAVAMATRCLYLLTWEKLFHLSCLLCIHKSEWS